VWQLLFGGLGSQGSKYWRDSREWAFYLEVSTAVLLSPIAPSRISPSLTRISAAPDLPGAGADTLHATPTPYTIHPEP
jgi:hypothetical protein